jgi:hypothetical protein
MRTGDVGTGARDVGIRHGVCTIGVASGRRKGARKSEGNEVGEVIYTLWTSEITCMSTVAGSVVAGRVVNVVVMLAFPCLIELVVVRGGHEIPECKMEIGRSLPAVSSTLKFKKAISPLKRVMLLGGSRPRWQDGALCAVLDCTARLQRSETMTESEVKRGVSYFIAAIVMEEPGWED